MSKQLHSDNLKMYNYKNKLSVFYEKLIKYHFVCIFF
jgi:hypothetical protein